MRIEELVTIFLRRVKEVETPGRRARGRPKKTWNDFVRGDLSADRVPETAAEDNHFLSNRFAKK